MQLTFDSASDLARALRRAADAHAQHEEQTGHPDPDWPYWYAHYLEPEQAGPWHVPAFPARLPGPPSRPAFPARLPGPPCRPALPARQCP
jgi:hypothetical protein